MTVLRREDVQSRSASWERCRPYRIASSRVLGIVPRIIRRLRGPSPPLVTTFPFAGGCLAAPKASVRRGRLGLQRGPDPRPMPIVPGGFHQHAPHQDVPRLGDAAPADAAPHSSPHRGPSPDRTSRPGHAGTGGSRAARPESAWPTTCRCHGSSGASPHAHDTGQSRPPAHRAPPTAPRGGQWRADSPRRRGVRPRAPRPDCRSCRCPRVQLRPA
jgi:hypothetical protein